MQEKHNSMESHLSCFNPLKGSVTWIFGCLFVDSLNKLLKKTVELLEMAWHSCDGTEMLVCYCGYDSGDSSCLTKIGYH